MDIQNSEHIPRTIDNFKETRYYKNAREKNAESVIREGFSKVYDRIKDSDVGRKAKILYDYMVDPSTSKVKKTLILAGLLYLINPFDIFPDLAPIVGFLDDLGIITLILNELKNDISTYQAIKKESDQK